VKHVRLIVAASIALVAITGYAAFKLTPWPSVWLIRHAYHDHASKANASLAPLVPGRVSATYDLSYSRGERDASFDVFAPADATRPLPVLVWVHGGGYVAGSRSDLSNYLQILAARGFVTVAIDYSLAPGARFPTPVKQTNQALAYLSAHADELHIDSRRIFLAGDSAGAQIAAQTALVISDSSYAKSLGVDAGISRSTLRGIVLYCGPYDPTFMTSEGMLADFKRTVLLSYMGTRDPNDPRVAAIAVTPHLSSSYPPAFISVGNADPLAPQSRALARTLAELGVPVDTLFFASHIPPLRHGYQALLTTDAARLALERSVAFLTANM